MKQGLEDANSKLNTLVNQLTPPAKLQGSGSTSGLATCPSAQVVQPLPFSSLHAAPSIIPTISDSTISHLSHASQPDEPAWTTTSFSGCSIPLPPHAEPRPTRTITLAGRFKLSFLETDVPHAPAISFADDLDALNSMWDDTSSYWKGHSALVINNFPIAIMYWKQVYTSKNGKNWKSGQWKILKGRYFEWRVSLRILLWLNTHLIISFKGAC
jgi:hypothetical protein